MKLSTLPDKPTAQEALDALKDLFIEEHGSLEVAIIWRYLDNMVQEENKK